MASWPTIQLKMAENVSTFAVWKAGQLINVASAILHDVTRNVILLLNIQPYFQHHWLFIPTHSTHKIVEESFDKYLILYRKLLLRKF